MMTETMPTAVGGTKGEGTTGVGLLDTTDVVDHEEEVETLLPWILY